MSKIVKDTRKLSALSKKQRTVSKFSPLKQLPREKKNPDDIILDQTELEDE